MMKNFMKYIAFLIGLLAGVRLLVEELTLAGFIENENLSTGWVGALSRMALTPLPISNILILVCSLSILGILLFRRDSPKPIPTLSTPQQEQVNEIQPTVTPPLSTEHHITKERVEEEWQSLEEADQEAIREMIIQGGLWESDIIALLQARGFLYHNARYDSLADRVSFVQCDYASYHSILPEYHAFLEGILAADYAENPL
jgi:hypothetical protein